MIIVKPSFEIMFQDELKNAAKKIEVIARTCYKSEDKISDDSAEKLVKALLTRGHYPMFDHQTISVRIVCDRGVSHEIVRHRIAAYAQESTRYCNYSKNKFGNQITVIKPSFFPNIKCGEYEKFEEFKSDNHIDDQKLRYGQEAWALAMFETEGRYNQMVETGYSPQEARSVLPNSLKTEIVCTLDLTAWRHFMYLRTAKAAHPQMLEIARPLLDEFKKLVPLIFDDITY